MKVAIIIRSLGMFGGGERNVVSLIEGLNRKSIIPDVFSEDVVRQDEIKEKYSKIVKYNIKKIELPTGKLAHFLQEIFFSHPIIPYLKEYDFIYDFSNKAPLVSENSKYLKYTYVLNDHRTAKFSKTTYFYIAFTNILSSLGVKKFRRIQPKIINVTQSEFIQEEILNKTGMKIPIIYPPVDLAKFYCSERQERAGVVSLGRFSPEKNYFMQIELAKKFPKIDFTFIGSVKDTAYFQKIKNEIKANSIKNITLFPDATFSQLKKLFCKSEVFLHSTIEEHFGLSTVEAMAAGCLPLVHNSGGQRDVVKYEEFRFDDIQSATEKLKTILSLTKEKKEEYHRLINNDIQKYSEKNFQSKMTDYLNL